MKNLHKKFNQTIEQKTSLHRHEHSHFSQATMEVAKRDLKEFESKTEEAFLIRAEMDRKLNSL